SAHVKTLAVVVRVDRLQRETNLVARPHRDQGVAVRTHHVHREPDSKDNGDVESFRFTAFVQIADGPAEILRGHGQANAFEADVVVRPDVPREGRAGECEQALSDVFRRDANGQAIGEFAREADALL